MNQAYYESVRNMEQAGVDPEYILGWQCGYLRAPQREEQRVTDAYEAGYEKGLEKDGADFEAWVKS